VPANIKPDKHVINTPDKANAVYQGGFVFPVNTDHADYAALAMANYMLGSGPGSRLWDRVREKEGLSYGVGSQLYASPIDKAGVFLTYAIYAPQNEEKLEAAFREEVARVLKDGFEANEIAEAKSGWLQSRQVSRAQDPSLARTLSIHLYLGRTLGWDADFERKVEALTGDQILQAMRKYLDLSKMTVVKAGDFKKGNAEGAVK